MPDNPLWMFRPFLSPAPLPLEVISQLQEPMKALQMWLFFSLLLVGAIFDCQKRLIPNTLCALITMVGLLVFHPAQLMGPLAALPLLAAAMHKPGSIGGGDIKFTAASGFVLGITDGLWGMALGLALAALFYAINWSTQKFRRRKCAAPSLASGAVPFLWICYHLHFELWRNAMKKLNKKAILTITGIALPLGAAAILIPRLRKRRRCKRTSA